jgi:ABC-type nickel/cobalt efflux system permease component RcnA
MTSRFLIWFGLVGLVAAWLACSPAAAAHPLDEFYQVTYIVVGPHRITLQVEQYPGLLIAPRILTLVDANQDNQISETERQAYAERFLRDIVFEIDGQPAAVTPTNFEFSTPLELRAGTGLIRFDLIADLPNDHHSHHQLYYKNNYQPDISVYLVNAISDEARRVSIGTQERDVFQSSLQAEYTINPDAPAATDADPDDVLSPSEFPSSLPAGQEQLTGYLYEANLSPLLMMAALGLAALLGGLHALTPGHGKTLVAAYLIGSRGTTGHAVILGSIVTFTHTASVIAIGLLALLASQFIVPNLLVPALEVLSGLLVVILGLRLLRSRWRAPTEEQHPHHPHDHPHDHSHAHDHDHHTHYLPEKVTLADLLTLGISGGLVPCPEALGVMLIAIGLNRILLGLGLIVAFSFGLAAVLIVIGILLVHSKSLLDRLGGVGGRWQRWLPLASALIVTVLGLGIVAKGVLAYLG